MESDPYCGISADGEIIRYGGKRKDRHRLYTGPSGAGKDTSHAIVDLLLTYESMAVFDPAAEALAVTGRAREKLGFVKVIDPLGIIKNFVERDPRKFGHLARFKSNGFDPLHRISARSPTLATDAAKISEVLHPFEGGDPFWTNRPRQLTNCLIMYEAFLAEEEGRDPSMESVMDMMTLPHSQHPDDRDPECKTLEKLMKQIKLHPYRPMARLAGSFIRSSDQVESCLATAITNCQSLISDEQIIADMHLGGNNDWERLKHEVGTYYIILPGDAFETHAVWLRLVLGDILAALGRTPPGKRRPLLKLNEVGNLGRIDALKRAIKMIRKNGVRIDTYWQDLTSIEEAGYGERGARTFIANAGVKTTWATDDETTMDFFSKRAGTETVHMDSYQTNQEGDNKNRHAEGVNVVNPEDVSALEDCTTLNFFHQVAHVQKLRTPHYKEICRGFDPNPYEVAA